MSSELHEDPVFNYRLRFYPVKNDVLRMDVFVDPGGGVSIPHYHPGLEERFDVVKGEATFTADGAEILARERETVVVEPGVRHSFKNTGEEEAHIVCNAEPAQDLQGFLTEAAAMARAGKYTKHGIPKGPGALLEAAEFTDLRCWARWRVYSAGARSAPPPRVARRGSAREPCGRRPSRSRTPSRCRRRADRDRA
jgi:quercetin dioxygenase-like cupin family protein